MKTTKFMFFIIILSVTLKVFALQSTISNESHQVVSPKVVKLDINNCKIDDLMTIDGISKSKAKNIISYRDAHGKFESLSEIKLVKGFKRLSAANLKQLENFLYIKV